MPMHSTSSTSTPTSTGSTSTTGVTELGKALLTMTEVMAEIKKSVDGLVEKVESAPQPRKGVAVLLEKKFQGHSETNEADPKMAAKLASDPEVTYPEFHNYRTFGVLPEKYQNAA